MRTTGLEQYLTKQKPNTFSSVNEVMELGAKTRKMDKYESLCELEVQG